MGLDQYLTAKKFLFTNWENPEKDIELTKKANKLFNVKSDIGRVKEICWEVGYWRKANHIHKWFVDNVQDGQDDCKEYYIDKEQLRKLLSIVNEVLKDNSKAEELLPTTDGFFFGDTAYDEYYFKDLKYTKELIEKILNCNGESIEYYYSSSW
jgi:hypothetical protein